MWWRNQAAVSLLAVASLTVAGVGTGLATASSSASTHTLTFTAKQIKEHDPSKTQFIDVDKDVKNGKVIGYDIVNGKFDPSANIVKAVVALATTGGNIYGTFTIDQQGTLGHGKVTGGTGKYKGVTGTIQGNSTGKNAEKVTVTYHK